jgi:hypothetical protein
MISDPSSYKLRFHPIVYEETIRKDPVANGRNRTNKSAFLSTKVYILIQPKSLNYDLELDCGLF